MDNYNQYIIVDLPFENDLNDTCGNMWTKVGSPIIKNCSSFADINGNKLFNNALYLNGSSALYTNINLGGKDFTISFWVCPTVDKTTNNYIFIYHKSNWFLIEYINKNFLIRSNNNFSGNNIITTNQNLLNIWHHIALCYNHNESKIYIYLNGKFTQTYNYSLSNNNGEFIIGTYESKNNYYFTGYIKNFQIYNNIFENNVYNNIIIKKDITLNSNTKRLFSFNYDYNTNRKTKWNQKANMYILNPNIYNK